MESTSSTVDESWAAQTELFELLGSENWEAVLQELLLFTMRLLKNREWRSVWGGKLPGGAEAQDLVMDSVSDVLSGQRRIKAGVPPTAFLKEIIRSKISHLVERKENQKTERVEPEANGFMVTQVADGGIWPDSALVDAETEANNKCLLDLLTSELADDPALQTLIECHRSGIIKREEIATLLGIRPAEVTNLGKRLQRRLATFRGKYSDQNPFLEKSR